MLAAMDNIQEEQPGANTPWVAYDLRMLEDEISVKVRKSLLNLSLFEFFGHLKLILIIF